MIFVFDKLKSYNFYGKTKWEVRMEKKRNKKEKDGEN